MPRQRKHFAPEEKVSILRRHRLDKVPVYLFSVMEPFG
jgi:hypothetical protein